MKMTINSGFCMDQELIFPTQDKNRPKADFCPSGFINFGQQKSCTPIRIFFKHHIGGGVNSKNHVRNALNPSRTFFAEKLYFFGFDLYLPSDEQ